MLLRELVASSRSALSSLYPEDESRSIVARLGEALLGTDSYTHIIEPGRIVPDEQADAFMDAMSRLLNGEPLQYVLGYADFCGFRFRVCQDVLIPRPETEILCMEAIKRARMMQEQRASVCGSCASVKEMSRLKILDLCTGSGCIAWTLALSVPGSAVVGADISAPALSVAERQIYSLQENGMEISGIMEERCCLPPGFVRHDVLSGADSFDYEGFPSCFDVIVSNPPYVRESERRMMRKNVLDYEPALALFVPDDDFLKFYHSVADFSVKRLFSGGFGIVEINEAFGNAAAAIFSSAGMSEVSILKDFCGRERFISFIKP